MYCISSPSVETGPSGLTAVEICRILICDLGCIFVTNNITSQSHTDTRTRKHNLLGGGNKKSEIDSIALDFWWKRNQGRTHSRNGSSPKILGTGLCLLAASSPSPFFVRSPKPKNTTSYRPTFLRATALLVARICYGNSVRPSVRPSVCLSVTRVDQSKTVEVTIMQFSPHSSPIPLVFVC